MANSKLLRAFCAVFILFLFPVIASAHYGNGLLHFHDGFIHPLTGWDHILVAVGVGILATTNGNRFRLMVPALFVISMVIGVLAGIGGLRIPLLEQGILFSIAVLGWLLLSERMPSQWNLIAVCSFAIIHGNAHGTEVSMATGSAWSGIGGLVAATALLHMSGIAIVAVLRNTMRELPARKLVQSIGGAFICVALFVGVTGI